MSDLSDVLHDCLSSFQGLDHSAGVCCFDRDAAVAYLLSERSGLRIVLADEPEPHCIQPPDEPGLVAYEVEVVPHDWANDGQGWSKGRGTPEEVAKTLREYAAQVEFFTAPDDREEQQ